jgi:hypothetical protein
MQPIGNPDSAAFLFGGNTGKEHSMKIVDMAFKKGRRKMSKKSHRKF